MFFLPLILAGSFSTTLALQSAGVDGLSAHTAWMVCGPFANKDGASVDEKHKPEKAARRLRKDSEWSELTKAYSVVGGSKQGWRQVPPTARMFFGEDSGHGPLASGKIDFTNIQFLQDAGVGWDNNSVVYLYRGINSTKQQSLQFFSGSDDGIKLWFNGDEILRKGEPRGLNPYDDVTNLDFRKGLNHLLIKIPNAGGSWGFEMRPFSLPPQARVDEAIGHGVDWLLSRQLIDGSWDSYQGGYRNGQTALCAYTLIKMGLSPQHPGVLRALNFLRAQPASKTYSLGCQLMAVAAADDPSYRPWIEEMVGDLISWQRRSGSWAYPTGTEDLSVTQFAALGLWAASTQGVHAPDSVWNELVEGTLDYMCKDESVLISGKKEKGVGFGYHVGAQIAPRGSMTAAGVATLQLCKDNLGKKLRPDLVAKVNRAIEWGNHWIAGNFRVDTNPRYGGRHYYWLYGLERAGAFLDTEFFGSNQWYPHGAWRIISDQAFKNVYGADLSLARGRGSWGNETNTCFALLFLRRATRRVATGPEVASDASLFKTSLTDGPVEMHLTFVRGLTMWINKVDSPKEIVRVEYWIRKKGDQDWTLITEVAPSGGPGSKQTWSTRHSLSEFGKWELKAIAVAADREALSSGAIEVEVMNGVDPLFLEYGDDGFDNLLSRANPLAIVSSGNSASSLIDNKVFTSWLCAANDAGPSFTIETKRPLRVKRILFVPARTRSMDKKSNPRPSQLEIQIDNDENSIWLPVDPEFNHKTVLELPEIRAIRKLKVILHEPIDGQMGMTSVGFSEVEYQG